MEKCECKKLLMCWCYPILHFISSRKQTPPEERWQRSQIMLETVMLLHTDFSRSVWPTLTGSCSPGVSGRESEKTRVKKIHRTQPNVELGLSTCKASGLLWSWLYHSWPWTAMLLYQHFSEEEATGKKKGTEKDTRINKYHITFSFCYGWEIKAATLSMFP